MYDRHSESISCSQLFTPTEVCGNKPADNIFFLLSEFAKSHPKCEVIGVDISPTQHPDKPSNLEFLMEE